jgi:hydrogenase expression/formation protein HypD
MKYVAEFRDGALARTMAEKIQAEAEGDRRYGIMEFCGGHTHAIASYGIADLLPANVQMIHGPGCPVCVLPVGRVDLAIGLALEQRVILCTYGDVMRVPASGGRSLMRAKARGGDIRMVYSPRDAIKIARENPRKDVVFFAIGFETTTPATAAAVVQAARDGLKNFSILCCHLLTPAAIAHILELPQGSDRTAVKIDGFVGPGHVSIIIGSRAFERFASAYQKPVVIAGFEPLDVMQAILMLVRQINDGRAEVENEFTRAVTADGNAAAKAIMAQVFELRASFEWRGLGSVPNSALGLHPNFSLYDAERRFSLRYKPVRDHRQCECGTILRGVKKPADCQLFGTLCTPMNPLGSCMVSSEGACAAHYSYGRFRDFPVELA